MFKRKLERARDILKDYGMRGLMKAIVKSYLRPNVNVNIRKYLPPQSKTKLAKDAAEFWSSSSDSENHRRASHWMGRKDWSEDTWLKWGNHHFTMFEKLCLVTDTKRPIQRMVEWGPGGGSNAIRFAAEVSQFYGVDISKPNLDECKRQLERIHFAGFHPVHINAAHPEECLSQINAPCDLFLSTAVYAHFPGKEYGIRVTEIAHKMLAPLGLAIIQIRHSGGVDKERDYQQNFNVFTSYSIVEFWKIMIDVGFKPLYLIIDPRGDYQHAYFFGQKNEDAVNINLTRTGKVQERQDK